MVEEPPGQSDERNLGTFLARGMRYFSVVTQFVITLGVLSFIGVKVDERCACSPWGVLLGIFLGLGLGLWSMLRQMNRLEKIK